MSGDTGPAWDPTDDADYVESRVTDVLTAPDATVDSVIAEAALLITCNGEAAEADRLCEQWLAVTERPAAALVADPLIARGFAVFFVARQVTPAWAAGVPPLDLAAEQRAHRRYLARPDPTVPAGLFGDSPAGRLLAPIAERMEDDAPADPSKRLAAEAEDAATEGDRALVDELLTQWAARAGSLPRVAMLAGCERLAPLLLDGALTGPLGLEPGWPQRCAGELIAALRLRYPATGEPRTATSWRELIEQILSARATADLPPAQPPAGASAAAIAAAEDRLRLRLPDDYRDFLAVSDGLPADVVFPRLLAATELESGPRGAVVISERTSHGFITLVPTDGARSWHVVEWDNVLGATVHEDFRVLLLNHLSLLDTSSA
ncbi:MAG: SMI1/KNR4 family protein [Actinophytocola sp.]|nr:SMI1/KNR4 family protein [Actinophytocola sp.]